MKTTINYFLATATMLILNSAAAGNNYRVKTSSYDSLVCLEIKGRIFTNGKNADNMYTVELIENNNVVKAAIKNDNKSFSFVLKKNTYYAIRITKEGYAPKLISINTKIPDAALTEEFYNFSFETELFTKEEFSMLDEDTQDFPIAIVSFNNQKKAFDYSEKYTGNIKKCLLRHSLRLTVAV